jgi:hypothetical protein
MVSGGGLLSLWGVLSGGGLGGLYTPSILLAMPRSILRWVVSL